MSADPIGIMKPFAGDPEAGLDPGWMVCDGSLLAKADYPALYAAIGDLHADGDEDSDHFRIPDMQGKEMRFRNPSVSDIDTVGKRIGRKTIDLSHFHTMNDHSHTASGTTGSNDQTGSENGTNETTIAQNHTHTVNITTNAQSDKGSDTKLSASQLILNSLIGMPWIIRTK